MLNLGMNIVDMCETCSNHTVYNINYHFVT